jgi:hypothetical protein
MMDNFTKEEQRLLLESAYEHLSNIDDLLDMADCLEVPDKILMELKDKITDMKRKEADIH